MNKALAELIKISNISGSDPALVQGGGGNTSVKTNDGRGMYIKASGTALKDMTEKKGWRRVNLAQVRAVIENKTLKKLPAQKREVEVVNRLLEACDDNVEDGSRPSVEAHLHAFLEKCVIHLHPSAVGAYVNVKNGKAKIEKLFAEDKYPPLWVPYTDPGFMLAASIAKLVQGYKEQFGKAPSILFLEKHGLFVTAKTPGFALGLVRKVIKKCSAKLKQPKLRRTKAVSSEAIRQAGLSIRKAVFEVTGQYATINYFYNDAIAAFLADGNARQMLAAAPLAPDELVYSNGAAMWIEKCQWQKIAAKLTRQMEKGKKLSAAFAVSGVGLFVLGSEKTAETVREISESSFFVRSNARRMGGIIGLSKREQDFINKWESEAFRKQLAGGSSAGDLQERIAVVSGSGSGLGKSIAIGLARAGAQVGLADIDVKAAQETAELIKKELPDISTVVIKCDVTNEESVNKAFEKMLDNRGGLDILVNAAGLAPAYSLVDLPVDKWRLALEVNLTGYFLMAKAAAKIMIAQDIGGSIINISSKTGLEASKNNTPYNATKAGEIHMARGWAMELGQHGIRVNCVAPGNVFEGSKIWNPEYIKVCAKKYGIKPEEVIPYYVSKTILNREIKGQDVADSVIFLCSDKASIITGQILVADGGQVMVR